MCEPEALTINVFPFISSTRQRSADIPTKAALERDLGNASVCCARQHQGQQLHNSCWRLTLGEGEGQLGLALFVKQSCIPFWHVRFVVGDL